MLSSSIRTVLIPGLFLSAVLVILPGCVAPVLVAAGAAGGYYVAKDKSAGPGNFIEDSGITAAIKAKFLKEASLNSLHLHVDTLDGEVTLSGVVSTPEQKQIAIDLARETRGVKKVIVKLDIRA